VSYQCGDVVWEPDSFKSGENSRPWLILNNETHPSGDEEYMTVTLTTTPPGEGVSLSDADWIDLEFVERERTPDSTIEVGMRLYLAHLSLSNTKQYLGILGIDRSRTAIHDRVQKTNLQPDSSSESNQIALDSRDSGQ
jgi:hypothetical protein